MFLSLSLSQQISSIFLRCVMPENSLFLFSPLYSLLLQAQFFNVLCLSIYSFSPFKQTNKSKQSKIFSFFLFFFFSSLFCVFLCVWFFNLVFIFNLLYFLWIHDNGSFFSFSIFKQIKSQLQQQRSFFKIRKSTKFQKNK